MLLRYALIHKYSIWQLKLQRHVFCPLWTHREYLLSQVMLSLKLDYVTLRLVTVMLILIVSCEFQFFLLGALTGLNVLHHFNWKFILYAYNFVGEMAGFYMHTQHSFYNDFIDMAACTNYIRILAMESLSCNQYITYIRMYVRISELSCSSVP